MSQIMSAQFNSLFSFQEPDVSTQGDLNGSLGTWTPATHPEGALYFYDQKRVCLFLYLQRTVMKVM